MVTKKGHNMNIINNPNYLVVGRTYLMMDKNGDGKLHMKEAMSSSGRLYFDDHIWTHEGNNQGMDRWTILAEVHPDTDTRVLGCKLATCICFNNKQFTEKQYKIHTACE